ncbi:MAG: RdgB/HAM1 family non-canonical purine NTP pyrophosphatase [Thermoproteota archaeon]|jgi:XTP/dITP diphosphohydrolase|nr:RdgB/HAM1 family non-canonical purine NTP pyrophosphatase [Thermoproteota archaeon]
METIVFASTNQNKFLEVQLILSTWKISVEFLQIHLVEIQSDSLEEIATEKAKTAFAKVGRPIVVEDDGLFIDSLGGFPGQYSSFVFKTIGNSGIIKLLAGSAKRSAYFRSLFAFYDGRTLSISEGRVDGKISCTITDGGWGYDPIFVPAGADLTFAQLKKRKNDYSHRKRALEKFARWYIKL